MNNLCKLWTFLFCVLILTLITGKENVYILVKSKEICATFTINLSQMLSESGSWGFWNGHLPWSTSIVNWRWRNQASKSVHKMDCNLLFYSSLKANWKWPNGNIIFLLCNVDLDMLILKSFLLKHTNIIEIYWHYN